ncbi:hypothetical protein [Rubritalea sp.]|uniref:hypothetical protein n=1 Tax=Rubritalea sp. TaxID=2109375 RepID=UPI003EFA2049
MSRSFFFTILPLILTDVALADWRDDIYWSEFQEWASVNDVTIPTSTELTIGIVEAISGGGYVPSTTNAQLSDETINDISQVEVTSSTSSHATGVARHYFGNTSGTSDAGLISEVGAVNVYEANDFISRTYTQLAISWAESVFSHAWVGDYSGDTRIANTTAVSARLDATAINSNVLDHNGALHIVGVGNGASDSQHDIYCHSYNSISVGRTDGLHNYGEIPTGYEGAGRQKPELVAPKNTTSQATGATASVALLLRALAENHTSEDTKLPVVIKSCMLAGADKSAFSDWDNTSTRPIDEVYGAGQIDILNSFRILNETESSTGNVGLRGWHYDTIRNQAREFTITIPEYSTSANLCANLSWNRSATGGNYSDLVNYSLTLKNSVGTTLFSSDSSVDNVEHIWQTNLEPGAYTLVVNKSNYTTSNTSFALAWHTYIESNSSPTTITSTSTENQLSFSNLAPTHTYFLERGSDLSTWTPVSTLLSTESGTLDYNDSNTELGENIFYRLRYFSP